MNYVYFARLNSMIRSSLFVALTVTLFVWSNAADEKKKNINAIFENPLANGYGDDINWVKWEDAIETALDVKKPIFLLIHKNWCHASLKKSMQQSHARKAFKKLSEYFVMVNTPDDEEPYEEEYRPDGKYIPRLLFLDMNGDHLVDIKNKKAEYKNYAYYYSTPADILNSMKDVLRYFGIEVPEIKKSRRNQCVKNPMVPNLRRNKKDEKKTEEPKTEQKPKVDDKSTKEEKPKKEEKKSEL
ncbi:Thioredoxin domain-containing protein [Aphelenchoides besseyi]|nr:Thioredoxin domain-containing protein [Aphelenchoides besseyi]